MQITQLQMFQDIVELTIIVIPSPYMKEMEPLFKFKTNTKINFVNTYLILHREMKREETNNEICKKGN